MDEAGRLVRLSPNGSFGLLLGSDESGACEVELLGPDEEDYSVRVPRENLSFLAMAAEGDGEAACRVAREAVFCRLDVGWGMDLSRTFSCYLGRDGSEGLETWYEAGRGRAVRAGRAASGSSLERRLIGALEGFAAGCCRWHAGPPSASLEGWRWSFELFGREEGLSSQDTGAAPSGLRALIGALADAGCGCMWEEALGAPRDGGGRP